MSDTLAEIDQLHADAKYQEAYDRLKVALAESSENAEVLWRLARGARSLANVHGDDAEKRKAFTYEAFDMAKRGLAADADNWCCHKWMGVMLDLTGRYEGTKKRIENSFLVRDHFTRAVEKKPDDPVVQHCLGVWCFEVADLGWMQRKMAAAFFAAPPTSSYEDALKHLLLAEEASPNFYSSNLLYIGKAYLRMSKKAEAREYFQRTVDYSGDTFDDKQAKKEAADLLKKC